MTKYAQMCLTKSSKSDQLSQVTSNKTKINNFLIGLHHSSSTLAPISNKTATSNYIRDLSPTRADSVFGSAKYGETRPWEGHKSDSEEPVGNTILSEFSTKILSTTTQL